MTVFRQVKHKILKRNIPLTLTTGILFYTLIFMSTAGICDDHKKDIKETPWHISAQSLGYDNAKQLYIAKNDVIITGEQTRIEADYAEFSRLTNEVFARGNVILSSGEDIISCDSFNVNLNTQTGNITKGTVFLKRENFYLTGEKIEKTGESSYKMDKGSLTACSGNNPDWKISAQDINIKVEGYGTARNVVFWAKKLPAVYSPYLLFPVKTKRQSGLLIPKISLSERKGFQYEQPLFLALSQNTDATFYTDYMTKRGIKTGGEYRYVLDKNSKGAIFLDYLQDNEIDDGTQQNKDFSFSGTAQRTNQDRYWFRMKQNQELPNGFKAKVDIDVVSDADYLLEFKNGLSGFQKTNEYLEEEFGRSLDDNDVTLRKNSLNLTKSWSNYLFTAEALWYDNVVTKQNNQADTTLQTLPALKFNAFKQKIANTLLYYTVDSEYRSFYRQDTTAALVNGQRADFYPKIYLPMRLNQNFQLEPHIGVRGTSWYTDGFTSSDGNSDNLRTRLMLDTGAKLSSKIVKVFNTNNSFAEKIKHELIPTLEYSFIPDTDQNDLPQFDSLDMISKQNLLTWSLSNYLISRNSVEQEDGQKTYTYNDFAYIKLYQNFDINKQKNGDSEPFSDLFFTGSFYPNSLFSINTDFAYSFYDKEFSQYSIGGTVRDKRGDMLTSEYRYNKEEFESLYSEITVVLKNKKIRIRPGSYRDKSKPTASALSSEDIYELKPELTMNYSIETNLKDNETIETQAGLIWHKECWSLELARTESEGEVRFGFVINLQNLGSF